MNKTNILIFLVSAVIVSACNTSDTSGDGKTVTREIKGTEIEIVAPHGYVPVCEKSIAVWTAVNQSLAGGVHLLTCFIKQGGWESENDITVDDLHPMMTVAIRKDMINESMTEEEFSGMLKVLTKPVPGSQVVLDNPGAYCFSNTSRKHIKVEDETKEYDALAVTCLTLVRKKYLLLSVEDEVRDESAATALQQQAREWVELMRGAN